MKLKLLFLILILTNSLWALDCKEKKNLDFYGIPDCKECITEAEKYLQKTKGDFSELEEYKVLLSKSWKSCNELKTEIKNIDCENLIIGILLGNNISAIYEKQTECIVATSFLVSKISEILNNKNLILEIEGIQEIKDTEMFDFYSEINYENYSVLNKNKNNGIAEYIITGDGFIADSLAAKIIQKNSLNEIYENSWKSKIVYNLEKEPRIEVNLERFLYNLLYVMPPLLTIYYAQKNFSEITQMQEFLNSDLTKLQKSITIINSQSESANSLFLERIKEYNESWEKLQEKRKKLMDNLNTKKQKIKELEKELSQEKYYYIDKEFLEKNYEKLGIELKLSMENNSLNSFADIPVKTQDILLSLEFKSEKLFLDIVLLEEMNQKADKYLEEMNQLKEASMDKMKKACVEKAKEKEKEYSKIILKSDYADSFEILKTKTIAGNLEACSQMLVLIEEIDSGNQSESTMHKKCVEKIKKIIEENNLSEYLELTEKSEKSLQECLKIEEELDFSLGTENEVSEIEKIQLENKLLYNQYLKLLDFSYQDNSKIQKEFEKIEELFSNNIFKLENYSEKEDIKKEVEEFNDIIKDAINEAEKNKFCASLSLEPLSKTDFVLSFEGKLEEGEISCKIDFEINEIDFFEPIENAEYKDGKIFIKNKALNGKISFIINAEIPYSEQKKQEVYGTGENSLLKTTIISESNFPRIFKYEGNIEAVYINGILQPKNNSLEIILKKGKNTIEIYEKVDFVERKKEIKEITNISSLFSEITYIYTITNKSQYSVKEILSFGEEAEIKDSQGKEYKNNQEITLGAFETKIFVIKEKKILETEWPYYKAEVKAKILEYSPSNKDSLIEEINKMEFSEANYLKLNEIENSLKKEEQKTDYKEKIEELKKSPVQTAKYIELLSEAEKELEKGNTEKTKEKIEEMQIIIAKEIAKKKAELEGKLSEIKQAEEKDRLYAEFYSIDFEGVEALEKMEQLRTEIEFSNKDYASKIVEEINLLEKELKETKEKAEKIAISIGEVKKANPQTVLPVQQKDIETIGKNAEKILGNKEFIKKSQIEREIELKNNDEANKIADSLYAQIEKDKKESEKLKIDLETAEELIKTRAIEVYNVFVGKQDELKDKNVLEKAKEAIEQGNYTKALGYLSLGEVQERTMDWFSVLLPLVGVAGFGTYFFMVKKPKKEKEIYEIPDTELTREN